jgi:dihydrofolate reductase
MIEIISAVDGEYGIGKDNKLPWHYSSDLKYFRNRTVGHNVIMGTKTWDSLGKPLKERNNIVISGKRVGQITHPPVEYYSINTFFNSRYRYDEKFYVIGGGQIYKTFLEMDVVRYITLTHIPGTFSCDVFFPSVYMSNFNQYDEVILEDGLKAKKYVRKVY